jgi:hypothetical protein
MVHRGGLVYMPTSTAGNVRMMGTRMAGKGMGSVLLRTGGAGAGSSYSSVDDFVNTTGLPVPTGRGLGNLSKKLESLIIKPSSKKAKNINFSL